MDHEFVQLIAALLVGGGIGFAAGIFWGRALK